MFGTGLSFSVFLGALLCACSVASVVAETEEAATSEALPSVEAVLGRDPQQKDYQTEVRCISARSIRNTQVLDEQHVLFEVSRNRYYLVQFNNRCLGLRKNSPIRYFTQSNRLCKLDSIQSLQDLGFGRYEPGAKCFIPGFQEVTKDQVALLKENLKTAREAAREERRAKQKAHQAEQRERRKS
ncbi:MAG TPA: hypothetical protein DCP57_09860 [Gammaproteobacteria bacterium]|nr:hypothetical protein [Gammaproteobacteria bacterium]